jgi:hypothetical protein
VLDWAAVGSLVALPAPYAAVVGLRARHVVKWTRVARSQRGAARYCFTLLQPTLDGIGAVGGVFTAVVGSLVRGMATLRRLSEASTGAAYTALPAAAAPAEGRSDTPSTRARHTEVGVGQSRGRRW